MHTFGTNSHTRFYFDRDHIHSFLNHKIDFGCIFIFPVKQWNKIGRTSTPLHNAILEFMILFCQLCRNGFITSAYLNTRRRLCIFHHISYILIQYSVLDISNRNKAVCVYKFFDSGRHSAYNQVLIIKIYSHCVYIQWFIRFIMFPDQFSKIYPSQCP